MVLPIGNPLARQIYDTFKDTALQSPDVLAVSGTSSVPGGLINILSFKPEGAAESEEITIEHFMVDHDFVETLGLDLIEGRAFSLEFPSDTMEAFILNEAAVRYLGWEDNPLEKRVTITDFKNGRVIGVVRNFHAKSLYQRIEPLLLHIAPNPVAYNQLIVRIAPGNYQRTLSYLESVWKKVYPRAPFSYSFLKDDFDSLYRAERQRGKVFLVFSMLAIFIACLGLFGLAWPH